MSQGKERLVVEVHLPPRLNIKPPKIPVNRTSLSHFMRQNSQEADESDLRPGQLVPGMSYSFDIKAILDSKINTLGHKNQG
jgi:hypothetical protein